LSPELWSIIATADIAGAKCDGKMKWAKLLLDIRTYFERQVPD
jgi:hypothetical protein